MYLKEAQAKMVVGSPFFFLFFKGVGGGGGKKKKKKRKKERKKSISPYNTDDRIALGQQ